VISAFQSADFVCVGGIVRVGKSCVVLAVSGYIVQRPCSFPIFLLNPSSLMSTAKETTHSTPYQELASAFQAVFEDFSTDKSELTAFQTARSEMYLFGIQSVQTGEWSTHRKHGNVHL
jgi:hypothetical protein